MSWLQSLADFVDKVFRGGFWKKHHKDYFGPDCYAFAGSSIRVYLDPTREAEFKAVRNEIIPTFREVGLSVVWTNSRTDADVVMIADNIVPSGGMTDHTHDPLNPAIITHAIIHIALSESGSSQRKTGCHETTHLYRAGHSSDEADANHSPNFETKLSGADKATLRLCYKNRKPG